MVTCSVNAHAAAPSATIFEVPVMCNGRAVPRCGGSPMSAAAVGGCSGVPEICQKLRYTQPHPAPRRHLRQGLSPARLCGHVRCCTAL
jgi:hypothetical protein